MGRGRGQNNGKGKYLHYYINFTCVYDLFPTLMYLEPSLFCYFYAVKQSTVWVVVHRTTQRESSGDMPLTRADVSVRKLMRNEKQGSFSFSVSVRHRQG
jgi:hypothetical protein